ILFYDQLLFRPLVAWADHFRFEQEGGVQPPRSWALNDSSRRSVELELKARHPEILSVTNVAFETILEYNTAVGGEPTQRLDAILVELREMRKELVPLIRSATFWFFVVLSVLAFSCFGRIHFK